MGLNNRLKIAKMISRGYASSLCSHNAAEEINNGSIDFVVTWVNGEDSEWDIV